MPVDEGLDRFTVDEGVVKITYPAEMTADSVADLEDFFALFIKRRSVVPEPDKSQLDKFKEAARDLETDDEARFDERLRKIVKHKSVKKPE